MVKSSTGRRNVFGGNADGLTLAPGTRLQLQRAAQEWVGGGFSLQRPGRGWVGGTFA